MKRFFCLCGQEVFFHDLHCAKCGRDLGFDPQFRTMWSGEISVDNTFNGHVAQNASTTFSMCQNRFNAVQCNWLLPMDSEQHQCLSCCTTRTIPDQKQEKNAKRWRSLERAKRHLFLTLLNLDIIQTDSRCDATHQDQGQLQFDFLEDRRSNPNVTLEHVLSGHYEGLITINAAEADEGFLHTMKEKMHERYRTLLGHFRHEIGHYFWFVHIQNSEHLASFRWVFGDESVDYESALETYYNSSQAQKWRMMYITPYASSHPHEDWAETWSHYLHIVDTLETAVSYGLSVYEPKINDFDDWFAEWDRVAQIMNALNRSMGLADAYPFSVSKAVQGKLRFIDEVIDGLKNKPINKTHPPAECAMPVKDNAQKAQ